MRKVGQMFSGDIGVASLLFLFSLALVFYLWNANVIDINQAERLNDMTSFGIAITDGLIISPGVPNDWNAYYVTIPGLAEDEHVLDPSKVLEFVDLMDSSTSHYSDNKHLLGLGIYDFHFNITDINQINTYLIDGIKASTGLAPVNATDQTTTVRFALLNNETVKLLFTIWQ